MNVDDYKQHKKTCTTLLVGKEISVDGSTLIARNEDGGEQPNPQKFVVIPEYTSKTEYVSKLNNVRIPLSGKALRHTATPDADDSFGIWEAAGINSENVAMTATETSTTNEKILMLDPLVPDGIGETDITAIVLPYINTAREGVLRLGELLERHGTYESNGLAFSDENEIWYMETIGGHHWVAMKIPNNAVVIAPNQFNIDWFNFNSKNSLYSNDMISFIQENQLASIPKSGLLNLRPIFGSDTDKDRVYNTPRTWFGQAYFLGHDVLANRTDDSQRMDLPFLIYPEQKVSVQDVKYVLSSYYQDTKYNPYLHPHDLPKYRPIGINRNQETHILQIRNNVPKMIAGVHWLAYGPNTFNALTPFYANVDITPESFSNTTEQYDSTNSYWLNRTVAIIGDQNFDLYKDMVQDFENNIFQKNLALQQDTDKAVISGIDPINLSHKNEEMAHNYMNATNQLLGKMINLGTANMTLRFPLDD
ncbi:C69 family dipeptidase [Weissella tructae]|uniref:Dipeptidase n=2 Tax=Weissella TaxID=46255 RepID=A0A075U5T0_9LACO|nr:MULTISPECIES: C69 family dipeptidase [Weissella]AIG65477.1 Peptidase, C69 family [Weissella tructae]AIM62791.1 Peptidase, C69 family [Weissella ceti]AIM64126.1 Peptidase, C69 family [Weissella ceti]ELA07063.1 dipeptidase [Weissella ceti NC36]QVV91851.1 C69 family dipeptidase [Weissella tructae]